MRVAAAYYRFVYNSNNTRLTTNQYIVTFVLCVCTHLGVPAATAIVPTILYIRFRVKTARRMSMDGKGGKNP